MDKFIKSNIKSIESCIYELWVSNLLLINKIYSKCGIAKSNLVYLMFF